MTRMHAGLDRMVGWSTMAHVTLLACVALVPANWLGARLASVPEPVVTFSVSGTVGPRDGGLTPVAVPPRHFEQARTQKAIEPRREMPVASSDVVEPRRVVSQTGAPRETLGLTTGGGGTGAPLDAGDFCCPEYIATMQELIHRHWTSVQQVRGTTIMKFTIERDGRLTGIAREKSSGQTTLDYLSERALLQTGQLPPLPAAYTQPSLIVHLSFEYQR